MDMKWFYGIFAFITFVSITYAAKNNIPRLYSSQQQQHRYRNQVTSNFNNNNNNYNSYNSNNNIIRDDERYAPSSSTTSQWRRSHQQQHFPWKNDYYFFRQIKNSRTCGKMLKERVSNVCGGCPPDGLTSIRKRSGPNPKIVEACCIGLCGDDLIKTIACNECNV